MGVEFKGRQRIYDRRMPPEQIRDLLVTDLPAEPAALDTLIDHFVREILPLCKNEASPQFLGFGDTGDDPAGLIASVLASFTQQNLINQSFDAPSATFIEIAVMRWLRELLGFPNLPVADVATVWDVGGVITHGGTGSNTTAMMLARENKAPKTMHVGVTDPGQFSIIVPRGIGHYSVRSSLTWLGVGSQTIEVPTDGFRYDLRALRQVLDKHAGQIMAVVAYAGDSRTQTVDRFDAVADTVREADPKIWLHADACWGLICAFSDKLRPRISGIERFDSITVDPHKVMGLPYGVSSLLVREPQAMRLVSSYSDLIMQENYAFGQVTPFIGSKGWLSLKLWMMMRYHGRAGLARLAEQRIDRAATFAALLDDHPRMLRLHDPDMAAVAFLYLPEGTDIPPNGVSEETVSEINEINRRIHAEILENGTWYLHTFGLPDDHGKLRLGTTLRPLRFMANNHLTTVDHMTEVLTHIDQLGQDIAKEKNHA